MINATCISFVLLMTCTLIHYETLSVLRILVRKITLIPRRTKLLVVVIGAICSHCLQIIIFGIAYFYLRDHFGLGKFGGDFQDLFSSFLYFSTESYTSLGLGDIYPLGALRMLAGIEALTGLVMIGWTASFTYLEMAKYWKDR
jgi:hypothetical protein